MKEIKFYPVKKRKEKPLNPPNFGTMFSDYMFIMDYDSDLGWHNYRIEEYHDISLSPAAACLHYGQTVFEGLKVIKVDDKQVLFRPLDNFKRLNNSALRMGMPSIDSDFLVEALITLLQKEGLYWYYDVPNFNIYIRPVYFATDPLIDLIVARKYTLIIFLAPCAPYLENAKVNLLVETNLSRVARKGTGEVKNGGNYGGAFYASKMAKDNGYSEVLWLDPIENKYIEEAGGMNIFFIINNKIVTPALNGSILPGITRDSIIKIVPLFNMEVEERDISIDELVKAYQNKEINEVFITGTAASVKPVDSITYQDLTMNFNYHKNSTWLKLYNYLEDLKQGKIKDVYNFLVKV
ncbi:MAG: branched-chain amino acid aminotransferase [Bacilli bacterium]|jgi:branched-chain amino acid aminotransferase|nr:branched-chain amino acid aminotransferase [Bacilli bacterium]